MYIGGFHIVAGLFFVVACTGVNTFLIKVAYWLWISLRYSIYLIKLGVFEVKVKIAEKYTPGFEDGDIQRPLPSRGRTWKPKVTIQLFFIFLVINLSIYAVERARYFGNDNLYYKAKEYWVAGQVIAKTRKTLGMVLHPENPILVPYVLLQKLIYHSGKRYLPNDDGEIYVWYGAWFLHPYAQRIKLPYGVVATKSSAKMAELIEEFYNTMKNIQIMEIGDKDIYRKSLLDFPILANYYSAYNSFSLGPLVKGGEKIRTNTLHSGRLIELLDWLDRVKAGWESEGLSQEIWNNKKYLAITMQLTTLELLQDIALSLPTRGTFSCDHPIISRMEEEYKKIMSADPSVNSLLNLGKKTYGKKAYRTFVLDVQGSVGKYLINDVCKKKMPEEQYIFFKSDAKMGEGLDRFYTRYSVESVFDEELRPLLLYFYYKKDDELFCGEAMEMYSNWQKVRQERGEQFTPQEQENHDLILQGIDEMCLEKTFIDGERKNESAYCDLYLDRFLYLLDLDDNRSLPVLQREEAMKILDDAYQECEERRDEISRAKKNFE